MKVLVYFDANSLDGFEGVRVRKSIKGALEVSNTPHTGGLVDTFDIGHFISPDDESKIHHVLERNKPLITSSLYSEDDKNASFFQYKLSFNGKYKVNIKSKALRLLNHSNIVLVPCESCRDTLVNYGVTSDIRVVVPGINLSRFNFSRDDEKALFSRYYRRRLERKMVIGFGDRLPNIQAFTTFVKAAKACPEADFYYICPDINERKLRRMGLLHGIKCPKNCTTINLMSDDMYRSALMTANMIMFPGVTPCGFVSYSDAMAAKCQIVTREQKLYNSFFKHEENMLIGNSNEDLIRLTKEYLAGSIKSTTEKAYEIISQHTLDVYGEELLKIYKEQFSLKKK